jgi:hypothetical protein
VGGTFGGPEERYRGEEEGSVFVLRFRILDTPELDLWVQIPRLLGDNIALAAAPW